ncbi:MAG TPA: alpha/beta fold hydrolase [Phycisphaerales bacterium]|nr:alpha/beta fold hydrolase [Phycisphaerales bacterium]
MLWRLALAVALSMSPLLAPGCLEASAFYHPAHRGNTAPAHALDVRFPTTDGLTLHGWFFPARGGASPAPTVLHVHGNSGDVSGHRFACDFLADRGFNVLLFDYRGFGASDPARGILRRKDLVEDTAAALDYLLTRQDVDPERIAVFGYSLGAVLGLAAAERPEIGAVVAYAGFSTWKGVASDHAGPLGRALIARGYDATETVARLGDRPVLIVHGTADRVVPYRHAELIYAAAQRAGIRAELMPVERGSHISIGSDERVRGAVVAFLERELGAGP